MIIDSTKNNGFREKLEVFKRVRKYSILSANFRQKLFSEIRDKKSKEVKNFPKERQFYRTCFILVKFR